MSGKSDIWWCMKSGNLLLSFTAAPQRKLCIEWYNRDRVKSPERQFKKNTRHLKVVKISVSEIGK